VLWLVWCAGAACALVAAAAWCAPAPGRVPPATTWARPARSPRAAPSTSAAQVARDQGKRKGESKQAYGQGRGDGACRALSCHCRVSLPSELWWVGCGIVVRRTVRRGPVSTGRPQLLAAPLARAADRRAAPPVRNAGRCAQAAHGLQARAHLATLPARDLDLRAADPLGQLRLRQDRVVAGRTTSQSVTITVPVMKG
jgi:hypothetical protein